MTTQQDSFALGAAWGALVAEMQYDEQTDSLPAWTQEVFHTIAQAVEELPAEWRDKVVAAAVQKWRE